MSHVCVVSFKECWQDPAGVWHSYGGFPLQMASIASLFDEMTILICRGAPRAGGIPLPANATVVPLRMPRGHDLVRKLSVLRHLHSYVAIIARHARRADVVHVPLPGDIPFLGMLVAVALRRPLIARYGGAWDVNSQTTVMNRVTRTSMRLLAGGRNVMLAAGEGQTPPGRNISWLFSTSLTRDELERARPDLDRGLSTPPRFLYCGRLSPEKGVHVLLDALALLREADGVPVPRLVIAGDGPERRRLEEQARERGIDGNVTFVGQLDRAALLEQLAVADVCVQPSLSESFGKAWLDAMSWGLPVVTSQVGAARAAIGGDGVRGWLVRPGDADALAATLRRILDDGADWPALRRRCRRFAAERSLDVWARRIRDCCARQWGAAPALLREAS